MSSSRWAPGGMVCSVDHLASAAGADVLRRGGSAADGAIAASAVLAVTTQHMCGLGGDLFALVARDGTDPEALNASGRSGSGADPDRLRGEGHEQMPFTGDIRSVPVPGCVDGWLALHERHGRIGLPEVLAAAIGYAEDGFPASPLLVPGAARVAQLPGGADFAAATTPGARVRRPGIARMLRAVATGERNAFYEGEFGEGLLRLGAGEYTPADLATPHADWVTPIGVDAFGHRVWTIPPNSQGYLTPAATWIAERLPLPEDPADPLWAHLTVEAARQAGYDRVAVLHEGADGAALLDPARLGPRAAAIHPDRAADLGDRYADGGTIYLCATDADGLGVSLIQSNAAGFGSDLAEPSTGIFLQNRGVGFSLVPGHPAEYGPRRRPPHTLAPALVTRDGRLDMVIGTMGGDAQPQVLLQLLVRILHAGQSLGEALAAPRWSLLPAGPGGGFSTWNEQGRVAVGVEAGAPEGWAEGLRSRGHQVSDGIGVRHAFGHAHAIRRAADGMLEGATDPRARIGAVAAY